MIRLILTRRAFCMAFGGAVAVTHASAGQERAARHPLLWRAARGRAAAFVFPFGEAKDDSWLTDTVARAFDASGQLWVELGRPLSPQRQADLYIELGHDGSRSFLDALEPPVRARAQSYMRELDISPESVQDMRPWLAYYTFATAYDKKHGRSQGLTDSAPPQTPPNVVLMNRARTSGTPLHAELTQEELLRSLAAMPDRLQSEYLEWLLDYFDDQTRGAGEDRFAWMQGNPTSRSNEQMRTKFPDLYDVLDARRNVWWALKIVSLLDANETAFIAIGQNHVLGPQGIPQLLTSMGLLKPEELQRVS